MLPVESLIEAVSFLPLYELDAVLLASRLLTDIASKCVKRIPVWQFEYACLFVRENLMALRARDEAIVHVEGRHNTADVLDIALHNASFNCLALIVHPDGVLPLQNTLALEVKELRIYVDGITSADLLVDAIARFRKVQAVTLYLCENINNFSTVIDLCRQKGIRSVVNTSSGVDLMAER